MTDKHSNIDKHLAYLEFMNREEDFSHTQYDEEMLQYELLKNGDLEAVKTAKVYFRYSEKVKFTNDPVVNMQDMFIVSATLATRFAIEGGMNSETAYNISDVFISRMHNCGTLEDIRLLHSEMIEYFTIRMQNISKQVKHSKPVMLTIEYVNQHLHEQIRMEDLCDTASLSRSYLSSVFKKETGMSVSDFITNRKIETAKKMLLYSDYSLLEISDILGYSSQSYFTKTFRKITGVTPKQYRKENYLKGLKGTI